MRWDANGIQLADVPGSGVTRVDSNARSGNPRHDTRSGKFGGGGTVRKQTPAPANVDPVEYARMLDAVREAARKFESFDEADITEYIKGRANSPDLVDIQQFLAMAREQRKADLVDIIDDHLRSPGGLVKRGPGKAVRLQVARPKLKRMINEIDEDGLSEIMHRLEAMGHDRNDVDKFFRDRSGVVDQARKKRDAVTASDQWKAFDEAGFNSSANPARGTGTRIL